MAPLSNDLTGVILPYDAYGTHLDASGKTVDEELERENFAAAGKALAEIWSQSVIGGYPVVSQWTEPAELPELVDVTERWKRDHVLQTQYTLQIRKCISSACCGEMRTNFRVILPDGLLPPPVPFKKTAKGLKVALAGDGHFGTLERRLALWELENDSKQFDFFCPTVSPKLQQRTCKTCKQYHPSKKALCDHTRAKCCNGMQVAEPTEMPEADTSDDEEEEISANSSISHVAIVNDTDVFRAEFEELTAQDYIE